MMKNFTILFLFIIVMFACKNENNQQTIDKNIPQVDTITDVKTQEFKEINHLLKNDINNVVLYLQRAKLYEKYNELDLAVKDVERAIKLDNLSADYYLLKAELQKKQNKFKEAKNTLDQCLLNNPDNLDVRIELGYLALVVKNFKQALDYADAVLKRDVYNAEAYYLKGLIFQEKGDTTNAISSYTTALEQENDYYDAYLAIGILYLDQDVLLAKEYLKNALRLKPKSIESLYAFGLACQEKGDYNEAIETYHKIIDIQEYREPYFNLGFIHQEYLKVFDVAIDYYTKAIEEDPNYSEAYYNRGLCYEKTKKLIKAENDFRKALQLNPQFTFAAKALERVLKN